MKAIYKCEMCGQIFEDYNEAYEHERKHWTLDRGWTESDLLDSNTEYKEGHEEPIMIHVRMTRWDAEKSEYVVRYGKYKLVSSYNAPLVITND